MRGLQIIPQFLQPYRRGSVTLSPKQRTHLSKSSHASVSPGGLSDDFSNDPAEAHRVRRTINHELSQSFGCIERKVLARGADCRYIYSGGLQSFSQHIQMSLCTNNDTAFTGANTRADKTGHRVQKEQICLVKLDEVLGLAHVAPIR